MALTSLPVELNRISGEALDGAIRVHRRFGPGLLERVYVKALAIEMERRGFSIRREDPIELSYEGVALGAGYFADIVVDDKVIIEIKAVEDLHPVHEAQLLTYLRLSRRELGLLINFNVVRLVDGFHRFALSKSAAEP